MATALLQLNPEDRIGAEKALEHQYFAALPKKLYELPDGKNFNIQFVTEFQNFSLKNFRNFNIHSRGHLFVSGTESCAPQ